MLPSMVSYNSGSHLEGMDEEDLTALGAAELADEISDDISEASFEFNPSELMSAPLFDNSDDELERIPSSSELNFNHLEGQPGYPAQANVNHQQLARPRRNSEGQTMFLDSNGFPVEAAPKVKSKRRPIPEDQRPRRIPGLVKQGSSRSSLLSRSSRATRSLQPSDTVNSGMGFNQPSNFNGNNMDMPIDRYNNSTMDVNINTSPNDMDITMGSPEPETLQVPGNDLRSYNDAMEKLCESMKRSAMSRNLVKELSNQSLQKDGSSRSIGSGSINVVSRNSSARSLVQQGSVRSLDGNGLGPLSPGVYPSQRHHRHSMEAKHHAHHRRGPSGRSAVLRHHSSSAIHGKPRSNTSMNQYDDSAFGLVFDGKNMYS